MATIIGTTACADEINRCITTNPSRDVVPLVGAGFSCNASPAFPLWKEIETWIAGTLKTGFAASVLGRDADDFTLAAEWYYYKADELARKKAGITGYSYSQPKAKKEFLRHVAPNLTVTYPKLQAHVELVNKFKKIYTTNWDCLLEEAINKTGKTFDKSILPLKKNSKWGGVNGSSLSTATHKLIKYHGCCEDKSGLSIVASRSDYDYRVFLANKAIEKKDPTSHDYNLHKSIPILIGYSYNDVNVRYVLSQVHSAYRANSVGPIYNLVLDNPAFVSQEKETMYEELYNIKTLFLLDENHDYHKLKARFEQTSSLQPHPSGRTITNYKKMMTDSSRNVFYNFFKKIN